MKEMIDQINQWTVDGKQFALARVIQTWGSSPRPVGSCMLISEKMEMAGSVSGGCVEGAVLKEGEAVFKSSCAKQLAYGVSDDDAWAVGLSCGGKIQVYLQGWLQEEISKELLKNLSMNKGSILITALTDGATKNTLVTLDGSIYGDALSKSLKEKALETFRARVSNMVSDEGMEYFVHIFPPRSRMIIIGAAHITVDLVSLAKQFDFETVVIDPRGTFARNTTFSVQPDSILEKYPSEVLTDMSLDSYTYAVILSHDPKIDDDALHVLLRSDVAYIGALGSKKNHEKRTARLLEKGFSNDEISKINAPVGVDINAQGAKEIALSIMGAVIKAKNANLKK
jgi:xanthine dehydrogenase accessory factor